MAVRPPQQGSDDPETIEFGIAALDARLQEASVEFPATAAELERELGDSEIPSDASGHTLALADALDAVAIEQFDTKTELLDALHPVFEEHRASTGRGILGQLRALLPF